MNEPSVTVAATPGKRRGATLPIDGRPTDERLTAVATDLLGIFRGIPKQAPRVPARDLTMGQLRLLFLLRREGPQPMGRLAEVLDLSPTASTGFVARIERHGLVARRHRSDDRRIVECELTDAGVRFLEELSGDRIETVRIALSALDATELTEFHRLLRRILEQQDEPA